MHFHFLPRLLARTFASLNYYRMYNKLLNSECWDERARFSCYRFYSDARKYSEFRITSSLFNKAASCRSGRPSCSALTIADASMKVKVTWCGSGLGWPLIFHNIPKYWKQLLKACSFHGFPARLFKKGDYQPPLSSIKCHISPTSFLF